MKELTSKTIQIIQKSLHVAEQVLTGGTVSMYPLATIAEIRDAMGALDHINTVSTEDDARKVADMLQCFSAISFTVRKGWANPAAIPSKMYDYTLDEYQAAVQRLGIPVGGENQ